MHGTYSGLPYALEIIILHIGSHNCAKPVDGEIWLYAMLNLASDADDFYPDGFREVSVESVALIGLRKDTYGTCHKLLTFFCGIAE